MKTTLLVVLLLAVAMCRHHRRNRADPPADPPAAAAAAPAAGDAKDAAGAKAPDAETSSKIEEMQIRLRGTFALGMSDTQDRIGTFNLTNTTHNGPVDEAKQAKLDKVAAKKAAAPAAKPAAKKARRFAAADLTADE